MLAASLIAYWAGEFANSYTMAKLKLLTNGEKLWTRTIGSTIVGQGVDTVLVITLTFGGVYPASTLIKIIVQGYLAKVAYEVLATPADVRSDRVAEAGGAGGRVRPGHEFQSVPFGRTRKAES